MLKIPYARQEISEADIQAVCEVLRSDWLTQGPAIERFEEAVAQYCGCPHAVSACNATSALHLACRALGLSSGDLLWTVPNTFVASANCALYCGAQVDFVDIDPHTYNLCVQNLEQKFKAAAAHGKLPKILVAVDFSGLPCDMKSIARLAGEYGVRVIEDASHAVGAEYEGEKVGSCRYADVTIFSFHPVKIITTGEGGLALTRDAEIAAKMRLLRSHGITRDSDRMTGPSEGPWYYQQIDLGYNYRLTDIAAALGHSQLQRIGEFVRRRRTLADRYHRLLAKLPLRTPAQEGTWESAWHLYVIQLELDRLKKTRRQVFERLRSKGVLVNVHYIPVHLQPYYRAMGFKEGDFPNAERYYAAAISLPMYYGLSDQEQDQVVETLSEGLA